MTQKSPFFSTIATFNRSAGAQIDRAKVDAIPYASLLAWFDGNAKALLVLGEFLSEGRLAWYSAEQQSMITWGPFVMALVGVEVSLRSSTLTGLWEPDVRRLVGKALSKSVDFEAPSGRVSMASKSRFVDRGVKDIDVFDRAMPLRHIREEVVAERWHHYSNDFWVDQAGFCWKSRQLVVPTMPPLNLVVTRPAKVGA